MQCSCLLCRIICEKREQHSLEGHYVTLLKMFFRFVFVAFPHFDGKQHVVNIFKSRDWVYEKKNLCYIIISYLLQQCLSNISEIIQQLLSNFPAISQQSQCLLSSHQLRWITTFVLCSQSPLHSHQFCLTRCSQKLLTTALSNRSEQHLTVFCMDPNVVYFINSAVEQQR